ncbi:hypothetical protein PG993_007503 [Apiospora rasikravindrae]|uniref:Xylanolytic transcriptional activator regulatory domain-containing protein n=1 Tax=Apiospora rasikravindrae TaxID=990691 RepID=A0ABR1SXN7_9PEZI
MPVFEEAQSHLLTPSMTESAAALTDPSDVSASPSTSHPRESEETLKLCLEVLSYIPPQSTSEVLFTRNINPNDTWLPGGRLRLASSLYEAFGASLEGTRRYSHLREMASLICSNSKARFVEDQEDPEEYMSSFCGTQMRWESLGILFTYWAFSASLTRDTDIDPVGQNVFTGRQMARRFTNCVSKCIDICRKLGAPPNTLFVYVCFRHTLLESNVSGDASLETWRAHAELVAITTFLGLHCIPRTTPYEPSVSSEIKRRLFACVYNIDKVVSSFTGRPPLLNARHVSTPLPLDIDDELLLGDRARLLEVARTPEISDERHFYDNKLKPVTIMRARGMMAFIRNDILDISLGQIHGDVAASLSSITILSPPPPTSSSSAAAEATDFGSKPPPKRSQIIQQLSLLVGFLEWIRPAAPNSELCQTVARIIRHVLDQTLDGPPRGIGGPEDAVVDWGTVDFATDVSNYFNFDLLDTFDWL